MKETLNKLDWPNIEFVIETGTHHGASSRIFRELCDKVYTVEISEDLYNTYSPELKDLGIICLLGTAVESIKKILNEEVKTNYLLFLDAHGSGGDTSFDPMVGRFGSPILEELEACLGTKPKVIIVDDWKDVQELESYPKPDKVVEAIKKLGDYSLEVNEHGNKQLICIRSDA